METPKKKIGSITNTHTKTHTFIPIRMVGRRSLFLSLEPHDYFTCTCLQEAGCLDFSVPGQFHVNANP